MCTKARLVQVDRVGSWASTLGSDSSRAARTRLDTGAARLDVQVDPAAHGEEGLGPITRGVILRTAAGQNLTFEMAAVVVR